MSPPQHSITVKPSRRRLLAGLLAGVGGAVLAGTGGGSVLGGGTAHAAERDLRGVLPAAGPGKSRKADGSRTLRNSGAGMHVGPDTAMGISTFTINPRSVTCGVGSVGNSPGAVPGTAALPAGAGTSGPFAMMMYATAVTSFVADRRLLVVTARGTMRSITAMGGQTVEDVLHPFVAQGFDRRGRGPDEFYLHFVTPFWNPGNPMATRSTLEEAWAMFGSPILFGEVNVA